MNRNKRKYNRITAGYKAEITFDNKTYQGTTENLSEKGASVTVVIQDTNIKFEPGKALDLKFDMQQGETLLLQCIIIWSTKLPPHGLINGIGLEIVDPPWDESSSFL